MTEHKSTESYRAKAYKELTGMTFGVPYHGDTPQPEHKSIEEIKKLAVEMFEGQFPNDIRMNKPDIYKMTSKSFRINEELKSFVETTVEEVAKRLSHLNSRNLLERFVDFALPYEGKNTNLAQRAFMICKIDEFIESEGLK